MDDSLLLEKAMTYNVRQMSFSEQIKEAEELQLHEKMMQWGKGPIKFIKPTTCDTCPHGKLDEIAADVMKVAGDRYHECHCTKTGAGVCCRGFALEKGII